MGLLIDECNTVSDFEPLDATLFTAECFLSNLSIPILAYALCGFNLMYPGEFNGFFGFAGFGLENPSGDMIDYASGSYTYYTDFIFQAMFAATAATIVSGAVAERVKLSSFLIFSTIYVAFLYPVLGSWKWGGGWLDQLGFYDFAGSTIVHSVGGWAALIGAYLIGPRIGKYTNSGIKPIMGHNMPLVLVSFYCGLVGMVLMVDLSYQQIQF